MNYNEDDRRTPEHCALIGEGVRKARQRKKWISARPHKKCKIDGIEMFYQEAYKILNCSKHLFAMIKKGKTAPFSWRGHNVELILNKG